MENSEIFLKVNHHFFQKKLQYLLKDKKLVKISPKLKIIRKIIRVSFLRNQELIPLYEPRIIKRKLLKHTREF